MATVPKLSETVELSAPPPTIIRMAKSVGIVSLPKAAAVVMSQHIAFVAAEILAGAEDQRAQRATKINTEGNDKKKPRILTTDVAKLQHEDPLIATICPGVILGAGTQLRVRRASKVEDEENGVKPKSKKGKKAKKAKEPVP